ncbi:MAG: HD domain-containing protein [Candidatus Latescibacteria bacterium]|nr:HD domain-containing protein [Candidatus Latescibacterota bacterium]
MDFDAKQQLKDLIFLSCELAEVKDLDVLMEKILQSAREYVHCDAGSIYIKKESQLVFSYTQNNTLQKLIKPDDKLIYNTFTVPINNNSIAGYVTITGETLNIPDVQTLPENVPFSFDPSYDEKSCYITKSVLTVPLKSRSGDVVGILQLINALNDENIIIPFDSEALPYVEYFANCAANALERAMLTRTILLRLIRMTELRDPTETGNHVRRVAGFSLEIYEKWAKKKGISQNEILRTSDVLHMAAMLHDVGKAAISDFILKKPGKLTKEEYETMKKHTLYGAQLLSDPTTDYEKAAQIVAMNHHEHYDGKGYPGHIDPVTFEPLEGFTGKNGLPRPKRGEEIPLMGRIVALADVYDALSFKRVYKEAWEQERVLAEIWEERGKQFDPEIVDAFFDSLIVIRNIADRYSEEDMYQMPRQKN